MRSFFYPTITIVLFLNGLLTLEAESQNLHISAGDEKVHSSVKNSDQFENQLFEKLANDPSIEYLTLWRDVKNTYDKKYLTFEEEQKRFLIFVENHQKILHHNLRHKLGLTSFSMRLNQFADLETSEFKKIFNGFKRRSNIKNSRKNPIYFEAPKNCTIPKSIDWREKGLVTPVKDQGPCGSCWAFSATGSLEGQNFKKTNQLVALSEQNLVDCSRAQGNEGCNGGMMDFAFQYVIDNQGLDTEKSYPYEGKDKKCRFDNSTIGTTEISFVDIKPSNETDLEVAVATVGPVSVGIDASSIFFQFYSKGVYYNIFCSSKDLDHGVLVVGYGITKKGKKYWMVKNSWGKSWGDMGYIKMTKGDENNCGIATNASYPIV